jgi:hypothetical protein
MDDNFPSWNPKRKSRVQDQRKRSGASPEDPKTKAIKKLKRDGQAWMRKEARSC